MNSSGFLSSFFKMFCCSGQKSRKSKESQKNQYLENFALSHEIISISIINVTKTEKPPFGELEVK